MGWFLLGGGVYFDGTRGRSQNLIQFQTVTAGIQVLPNAGVDLLGIMPQQLLGNVEREQVTNLSMDLVCRTGACWFRVILVDADLRRPSIHKEFGLSNDIGLTTMFLEEGADVDKALQTTGVEGLRVLTSGTVPPNPAEMLDSKKMRTLLMQLRSESDMVVLDSPPALAVADASILGSRCSGAVMVIDTGKTRTEASKKAMETLTQTQVKVVGVLSGLFNSPLTGGIVWNGRSLAV